ncbi:maleylpyruvate isomerase family mycothiol-dependent enzyme [Actinomycetes bacterium KLBMP 9797]
MNLDEVWQTIDEQRASFADLLDELSPAEWETPSLCAGWRVREVAAHLTLAHVGLWQGLVAAVRARGSFDRMIHDTAVQQARLPVRRYAPMLRAMVGSRRMAPTVTPLEPLIDILVHGQDVAIPLGRPRPVPERAAAAAATRVWSRSWPFRVRARLGGLRLVATDHPWAQGDGELVEGPIAAILLLLTGRTAAAVPRLTGAGVARLAART